MKNPKNAHNLKNTSHNVNKLWQNKSMWITQFWQKYQIEPYNSKVTHCLCAQACCDTDVRHREVIVSSQRELQNAESESCSLTYSAAQKRKEQKKKNSFKFRTSGTTSRYKNPQKFSFDAVNLICLQYQPFFKKFRCRVCVPNTSPLPEFTE